MAAAPSAPKGAKAVLRRVGFCGADDSCDPELLATISRRYPEVEWGVLLRPDKEGEPRYATPAWLARLAAAKARAGGRMHLAGHLCGERVPQVLGGDASYVKELAAMGFGRVQINATAANGVDTSRLAERVDGLRSAILATPEVEWIIQRNEETAPLWEALGKPGSDRPANMSFLFDASLGRGILTLNFAPPVDGIKCGYAGGMGPDNISTVLEGVAGAAGSEPVWVDMESSLRATRDGKDVFSVAKCFRCLSNAAGRYTHAAVPEDKAACPSSCCLGGNGGAGCGASGASGAGCTRGAGGKSGAGCPVRRAGKLLLLVGVGALLGYAGCRVMRK